VTTGKRKKEERRSTAKASRPRQGSAGPDEEFKIVAFYDKDKTHQYVVGTSGDHKIDGRIMRQVGRKRDISHAQRKYSVSDGVPWILRQYNTQLPMLDCLRECLAELKDTEKRQELENLREYIGKRIAMTDYPYFLNMGYDINHSVSV